MGHYVRLDKFGVVQANHLLTGGFNRVGTMGEKEVRVKLVGGDYVWYIMDTGVEKVIEMTRSIGRNYHGCDVIDENNYIFIPFTVDAAHTSVKLRLWGLNFPTFHYTELPQHNHGGQAFPSSTHTHSFSGSANTSDGGAHDHSFTGYPVWSDGENQGHNHGYQWGDSGSSNTGINSNGHAHVVTASGGVGGVAAHYHSVTISGTTGAPSGTTAIPNAGINGGTLNDTQKTVVDDLIKVYVTMDQGTWGTAKDKNTSGWSSLANINANGGTDEIDIFAYLTAGSFCYLKIEEPTAKKGGKIAWHLALS